MALRGDETLHLRDEYAKSPPERGAFARWLADQLLTERVAYGTDPRTLRGEEGAEFVRWNVLAAIRELTELLNDVDGWKPWQTERDDAGRLKDRDAFVEEGVDVLHFIANLLLYAGATDAEVSRVWSTKQRVNAARQETGYAGVGADWDAVHLSPKPEASLTPEARAELQRRFNAAVEMEKTTLTHPVTIVNAFVRPVPPRPAQTRMSHHKTRRNGRVRGALRKLGGRPAVPPTEEV
jgi:hypothetical protein